MLIHEISMAASVVSIDSAWMERKRLLISLMKEKASTKLVFLELKKNY
jgi:hypothetical protein